MFLGLTLSCSDDDMGTNANDDDPTSVEPKVFIGDITLTSQEEVNVFGEENYTRITGSLKIGEFSANDINNLRSLQTLQSIGGDFIIKRGSAIENMMGLENLEMVEGRISIEGAFLETLDGLESLTTAGDGISIEGRDTLISIDGLSSLESSVGIWIRGQIPDVNGLANLTFVDFLVISSPQLSSLVGLEQINNFSRLSIGAGIGLTDLTGLSSDLFQIGNLTIANSGISNLDDLTGLTELGEINLYGNSNLENLDALENLTIRLREISISNNSNLRDFCGLRNTLTNYGIPAFYDVSDNLYNPTGEQIVDGDCSL